MQRGEKHTDTARQKIREARKKQVRENHPRWKGKIMRGGYWYLFMPEHSCAGKQGYIAEHRFVMEKFIERQLTQKEIVHHINHIKTDNRIENLKLYATRGQHTLIEHPEVFRKAGKANKGKRHAIETEFKKGQKPWCTGKVLSLDTTCKWNECQRSANYRNDGRKGYCSKHIQVFKRTNTCPI